MSLGRDERGLSLIELLVGFVVFALLFFMVDGVFISAHRSARKTELGANVQQNGRIAIERLTREIREGDASSIVVDAVDGAWVAFRTARLLTNTGVFCINAPVGSPLYRAECGPTATDFTPAWQGWIVYSWDAVNGRLNRELQAAASPTTPGAGDVIATSVRSFDARCEGGSPPSFLSGNTFCVSLEVEGREVVQGSEVPPQQISLVSRVELRND